MYYFIPFVLNIDVTNDIKDRLNKPDFIFLGNKHIIAGNYIKKNNNSFN